MRGRIWMVGLSVAVAAVVVGARASMAPSQDRTSDMSRPADDSGRWTADLHTTWKGDSVVPRVQLSLQSRGGNDHWGFGVRDTDLQGLPAAARQGVASAVTFRLVREAGTLTFTGRIADGRGAGDYSFAPSASYASAMAALGYRDLPRQRMLHLAVLDVSTAFARELQQAGQTSLAFDDLVRFRIHGVTGALVGELARLGYGTLDPDTLVRMRIHGASPDVIRGFRQAGLTNLASDDLVRFRIHGVTPSFIRDMRALGFSSADEDDFVRMRIHGVSAAFVKEARADGYQIREADDAVDLAIHGRRRRR